MLVSIYYNVERVMVQYSRRNVIIDKNSSYVGLPFDARVRSEKFLIYAAPTVKICQLMTSGNENLG